MNKQKFRKIIIAIVVLIIIISLLGYETEIINTSKSVLVQPTPINTRNYTLLENKEINGKSSIYFNLSKVPNKFLMVVYSNYTSGRIELINPKGDKYSGVPLSTGVDSRGVTVIKSNPPSVKFFSGMWHLNYNINSTAHLLLYVEYWYW